MLFWRTYIWFAEFWLLQCSLPVQKLHSFLTYLYLVWWLLTDVMQPAITCEGSEVFTQFRIFPQKSVSCICSYILYDESSVNTIGTLNNLENFFTEELCCWHVHEELSHLRIVSMHFEDFSKMLPKKEYNFQQHAAVPCHIHNGEMSFMWPDTCKHVFIYYKLKLACLYEQGETLHQGALPPPSQNFSPHNLQISICVSQLWPK